MTVFPAEIQLSAVLRHWCYCHSRHLWMQAELAVRGQKQEQLDIQYYPEHHIALFQISASWTPLVLTIL